MVYILLIATAVFTLWLITKSSKPHNNISVEQVPPLQAATAFQPIAAPHIEPRHKPIGKVLARQIYKDTIKEARPDIKASKLRYLCRHFDDSIEIYLSQLEDLSPANELTDAENQLTILYDELPDEDDSENEPLTATELQRAKEIKAEIQRQKSTLKELQHQMRFYRRKDLRFLLALELNNLLCPRLGGSEVSYAQLIQAAAQEHAKALHSTPSRQ